MDTGELGLGRGSHVDLEDTNLPLEDALDLSVRGSQRFNELHEYRNRTNLFKGM